jgi:hypothetical protein
MDTDGIAMKIAIAVILGVLTFLSYKWWKDQSIEKMEAPMVLSRGARQQDPVPQEPGIIMYGNTECPWCTKQKKYFAEKNIEYTFVDCNVPGNCPNFVEGFPTIVKDGAVMPGYQEL